PPLVPRALRFGVGERVYVAPPAEAGRAGPGGAPRAQSSGAGRMRRERVVPSVRELRALRARLARRGIGSIAVGFLHAYLDPVNERLVGRALASLGVPVTLSHRVSGEYREYERFSTTI